MVEFTTDQQKLTEEATLQMLLQKVFQLEATMRRIEERLARADAAELNLSVASVQPQEESKGPLRVPLRPPVKPKATEKQDQPFVWTLWHNQSGRDLFAMAAQVFEQWPIKDFKTYQAMHELDVIVTNLTFEANPNLKGLRLQIASEKHIIAFRTNMKFLVAPFNKPAL